MAWYSPTKIVCVGVTASRYVSLQHARPWLVHSYRNIRGRGLHVVEEDSNTLPLDQTDNPVIQNEAIKDTEDDHPLESTVEPSMSTEDTSATSKNSSASLTSESVVTSSSSAASTDPPKAGTLPISGSHSKPIENDNSQKKRKLGDTDLDTEPTNKGPEQAEDSVESITESQTGNDSGSVKLVGTEQGLRQSKRRKIVDFSPEPSSDKEPRKVSTYDRVRLIIQPWRKPEGGINKPIFKMMLESVMLYFMMKPGSGEESLINRYKPYLQPMVLRNIVQILIDIGCLFPRYIKRHKVSLFSTCTYEEKDSLDEEDVIIHYIPAEDCLFKLGQFGKAMFPNVKWPDTTITYG